MATNEKQKIGAVIVEDLLASGTIRSCVNCGHLKQNLCELAGAAPPPEVIMFGCDSWEDEIPF